MPRNYDTSALFRKDTILRIKHLYSETVTLQKSMEETKPHT